MLDFGNYFRIYFHVLVTFSIVLGVRARFSLQDLLRSAFLHTEKHVFLINALQATKGQIQRSFEKFMGSF